MVRCVFVHFTCKPEYTADVAAAFKEFCVETRKEEGPCRQVSGNLNFRESKSTGRRLFLSLIPAQSHFQGCLGYECYQEAAEPTNFVFVETWKDDESAKLHVKTKHMDEVHRKINGKLRRKPRWMSFGCCGAGSVF
jgi:quinol monooxygenase YgiN